MNFKSFVRAKAAGQVTDGTLNLYDKDRQRLMGSLGAQPLTVETAQELEAWLRSRTKSPNTLQRWVTSLNWLLRWKGVDYQAKRPRKEPNLHPRKIEDGEYDPKLAAISDPMERLAVRLSHDTGWSPNDVVQIRKADLELSGDRIIIRRFRQKTGAVAMPLIMGDTAAELRAYLETHPEADYLFPGDRRKGQPHRNRTWVNAVLKRYGFDFTPRAFRSNLATRWDGADIKGLMVQGGWKNANTIFQHYRANDLERQAASLEAALGKPKAVHESDPDLPGYG